MNTITEKEFVNLTKDLSKWTFASDTDGGVDRDIVTRHQISPSGEDAIETITVTECAMRGWITATHGEIEITYREVASWYDDAPADFKATIAPDDDAISVRGVTVLDEYGDQLAQNELLNLVWRRADQAFFCIDWKSLIP